MRILVTGGLGFIGSNFIRYLLNEHSDADVLNVDDVKCGANFHNLEDLERDGKYSFCRADISDYDLISNLVSGVDVVVNFAAETHVDRSLSNPMSFLQSNVVGTNVILEALRNNKSRARLVHISTDEVYGDAAAGSFSESDPLRPSSPYSASKASSDLLVLAYVRTYGLDAVVTRCTNNYGPRQFPEKLIPKTIIRTAMSLRVPLYGSGENVRDWIHVLDHCRAVEAVLKSGEKGQVYNISAGEERTNLQVVKKILEIMGRGDEFIEFVEDRPGHDVRYSLDSSKIRRDLGWRPQQSFERGIRDTVKWYLENENWWRPLADEKVLYPTPWKLMW